MAERFVNLLVREPRTHEAKPAIQLVHFAIRFNAQARFADARAADQRRLSRVAGPRRDFRYAIPLGHKNECPF